MKFKKVILSTLFLFGIGQTTIHAQESISTSGGNSTGTGGTASYTVGQLVYTTSTGTNGSVALGVQQPFEISVVSGVDDNPINLSFTAYPNPTSDRLTLNVDNIGKDNLTYQLFDISGKLLESKKVEENETTISMIELTPAIYILKIVIGVKEVKSFKIIKN